MRKKSLHHIIGLMNIVFILISVAPVIATATSVSESIGLVEGNSTGCPTDNGNGYAFGAWEHNWKCHIPQAFSEVENLTINTTITEGTPHWIFLAAGTQEKQAFIDYIDNSTVPEKQKDKWMQFIRNMWKEYPVEFDNSTGNPMLVPGKSSVNFLLTATDNATFQEIEQFIADDMENARTEIITVKWYGEPTHRTFMNNALDPENIPGNLKTLAANAAPESDYWPMNNIPGYQQINHGYVPGVTGLAPTNFGHYTYTAKLMYLSHDYSKAFTNMGYASHYITDLGNPYHTPPVQLIPLEFVDMPVTQIVFPNSQMILNYKTLHDGYEDMVKDHWSMFFTGNLDRYDIYEPTISATIHGTATWAMSYPLIYDCYWHFIVNNRTFNFETNSAIVGLTRNRVVESMKNTRGLIRYVTGGQYPMLTITATAGPGGSISPPGDVSVRYGESQSFTITPGAGYVIDEILVDGNPETQNPYPFTNVIADHTITATFIPIQISDGWNWNTDGWGDWQQVWSVSGSAVGPNSEYGPVQVNDHWEYGTNTNLLAGSTQSSVWRTFTDPSGTGWNTITFNGLMTGSDIPGGRWMTIEVNNNQVFGGTASQSPPGNGVPFEIKNSFTQSPMVTIKITNGQSPAWGPLFAMHYYSVNLSRENTESLLKTEESLFVIPDGTGLFPNGTFPADHT